MPNFVGPSDENSGSPCGAKGSAQFLDDQFLDDLNRLRTDALVTLGWISGSVSYVCLILLIWPITGHGAKAVAWSGVSILAGVSVLAIGGSSRFQRGARYGYMLGLHVAAACGMLTLATSEGAYLFLLPVIYASVLFNRWTALANALLGIILIALLNRWVLGETLWSVTSMLSIAVTAIAAVASWMAAHNLFTALTWLSSAYAKAHTNEALARDRQAELQRVLKALDEAHYRLRRLNGLLVIARDQAEEGRRIKQYFAQTISHELRTPLNLVVGFAELMIESPEYYGMALPPAYLRDLGIVYRNAYHLQGLVNDVLDLARIEAAQMSLVLAQVEPGELLREAVETVRSLVEARGLTLTTRVGAELPPLMADATRIRQVLINLLNNAARFTRDGGVHVSVERVGEEVHFAIADSGIGIAPSDLLRIFDEFYQVDSGSNRSQEGAGLGLAISRKFVNLHSGRMWAESIVGQGSTFHFALPTSPSLSFESLARPLDSPAGTSVASWVGRDVERVLLTVTQSTAAIGLLSRYLPQYRVLAAHDLTHAQILAQQVIPQAIILDSGITVLSPDELRTVGQNWGLPQVPVIQCPLPGEDPLRQRLAVEGYLIKPVSRQNLWDILRSFGEGVEQILIVDDNRDFVRLLRQMLANPLRPMRIESAYSGKEALTCLRLSPPDLILLDLGLPDLTGLQIIDILRGHALWNSIPVVIVSAQDELEGLEGLTGSLTVTKAGGILSGDLIRWLSAVVGGVPTALGNHAVHME